MNLIIQLRAGLVGAAGMALLVAATSYVSPPLRCISTPGTVWVAPVAKCYRLTDFMPVGALEAAK